MTKRTRKDETIDGNPRAGAVYVAFGWLGSGLITEGNLKLVQGVAGLAGAPEENDQFGASLLAADFNACTSAQVQCVDTLVVGVPGNKSPGTSPCPTTSSTSAPAPSR
jgi:hypothetical protein